MHIVPTDAMRAEKGGVLVRGIAEVESVYAKVIAIVVSEERFGKVSDAAIAEILRDVGDGEGAMGIWSAEE